MAWFPKASLMMDSYDNFAPTASRKMSFDYSKCLRVCLSFYLSFSFLLWKSTSVLNASSCCSDARFSVLCSLRASFFVLSVCASSCVVSWLFFDCSIFSRCSSALTCRFVACCRRIPQNSVLDCLCIILLLCFGPLGTIFSASGLPEIVFFLELFLCWRRKVCHRSPLLGSSSTARGSC